MAALVDRSPFGPRLALERHRLDNGLVVLLLPDPSAPVVSVQTWYRVGSRHERPGRTGIAHLFEHLMFNQTEHLAAGEFDRQMELAGGETNAATWVDWTCYRDSLPAGGLELALRLEADRMRHLTLTDAQVDSEREVVANERRYRVDDDVEGFLAEELWRRAFTTHPYHWPTIGWMADIAAITTEDARAFYRAYYAPGNATLVLCGDLLPAAALALVERHYGAIPPSTPPAEATPVEPPQQAERRARFAKPVAADRAFWAWKSPPQRHPDWLAFHFLHEILLGGPSSRLYRRLVAEAEVAASVQGALSPLADPGLFEVFVALERGHGAAEAEAVIDEEIARLHREPPAAAELVKARNRIETAFWADLETAEGKAEALGHWETTVGDHRGLFALLARVPAVGADDLVRVARAYLLPAARTVVVAEPSGADAGGDGGDEGAEEAP